MDLDQLHDDIWAQVLLPKLVAERSAASVALSCRQLAALCHRLTQHLDLTSLAKSKDGNRVAAHTDALPQHFPGCCSVSLGLQDDSSSRVVTACVVPALARQVRFGALLIDSSPCFGSPLHHACMFVHALAASSIWCSETLSGASSDSELPPRSAC